MTQSVMNLTTTFKGYASKRVVRCFYTKNDKTPGCPGVLYLLYSHPSKVRIKSSLYVARPYTINEQLDELRSVELVEVIEWRKIRTDRTALTVAEA